MMNNRKLRLVLFKDCNRACRGCCNKDIDFNSVPVVSTYKNFDEIFLTGGEPLLRPDIIKDTIAKIKKESTANIFLYTAMTSDVSEFKEILKIVNGITLTLHTQKDIKPFENLLNNLSEDEVYNKSMRLNIFKNVKHNNVNIPQYWDVKNGIVWIKNCPLPDGEVIMKL